MRTPVSGPAGTLNLSGRVGGRRSAKIMKIVTVVATFHARPGQEAELKKALISLVAPTRQEAGCLNYDLHQSPEDSGKFLFHENWTSKAHLDAHLQKAPHIQVLLSRLDELCVGMPEIKTWEKIA
jgi:quinol monooxygenase YgiN